MAGANYTQLGDFTELERDGRDMHDVVSKPGIDDAQASADFGWMPQ